MAYHDHPDKEYEKQVALVLLKHELEENAGTDTEIGERAATRAMKISRAVLTTLERS